MTRAPIFAVDAETDGLYGHVWAIGACILTEGCPDEYWAGQLDPDVVADEWTRKHVVPVVDLERYASRTDLLNAFWSFWIASPFNALCVADFGAPVEAALFRAAVELDPAVRTFVGPYPLHELATALLVAGIDPHADRRELCGRPDLVAHDPAADALAAALCWRVATSARTPRLGDVR